MDSKTNLDSEANAAEALNAAKDLNVRIPEVVAAYEERRNDPKAPAISHELSTGVEESLTKCEQPGKEAIELDTPVETLDDQLSSLEVHDRDVPIDLNMVREKASASPAPCKELDELDELMEKTRTEPAFRALCKELVEKMRSEPAFFAKELKELVEKMRTEPAFPALHRELYELMKMKTEPAFLALCKELVEKWRAEPVFLVLCRELNEWLEKMRTSGGPL